MIDSFVFSQLNLLITHKEEQRITIKMKTISSLMCLLATFFVCQTDAFISRATVISRPSAPVSSVALQERRWNFNDGQSPWGMKKNAEIWNGRFAQVKFASCFSSIRSRPLTFFVP
jgi:hypothetical protein